MPNALNHIAISVTNIQKAKEWYRDVMGMTVLVEPFVISSVSTEKGSEHLSNVVKNVFGKGLEQFLICHLSSSNGVGLELFEFINPKSELRKNNFDYWKTGFFHISITEREIEKLSSKIESTGGRKRTEVMEIVQGSGKKICFCEDPFGNIIEIYSHSYEQFWASSPT